MIGDATDSYFSLLLSAAGESLVPQVQRRDDERWDVTLHLSLFISDSMIAVSIPPKTVSVAKLL